MARYYRWVVLALAWAAFTMTSADRSVWGPASASVAGDLRVSLGAIGVFATGYYLGYIVSNLGGGILTDRLGPRVTLGCSLFAAGVALNLFAHVHSVALGIAVQAVVGLVSGCDYAAGVKLITQWFVPSRRGSAMGVFTTATSLGTVIANAVVPSLIEDGWRIAYRVFGIASIVVAVLCLLGVRVGPLGASGYRGLRQAGALLRRREVILLTLIGFGGLWGTYGFITWSNALMEKGAHLSSVQAGTVVVIFGVTAVIGKPLIGLASDRFDRHRRWVTMVVLGGFVTSLLAFGLCHGDTAFLCVAPFLGLTAYLYSPLLGTMVAGVAGQALAGSAAGITNACWQIGSAVVPIVVGAVYVGTHSFLAAFATLAIGPLLGMLLLPAVRGESADAGSIPTEPGAPGAAVSTAGSDTPTSKLV